VSGGRLQCSTGAGRIRAGQDGIGDAHGASAEEATVLEQVIKDRGIQVLVNLDDADRVLSADPAIDITADVMAQLAKGKP